MAESIIQQLSSTDVLNDIKLQPAEKQDQVFHQFVMWNCDMLRYLDLHDAIESGDVGVMEQSLPHLLFRFAGGVTQSIQLEYSNFFNVFIMNGPPKSNPSKGKDLERLHDAHTSSQVYIEVEGCTAKTKADIIPDVVTNGALNIVTLKTMSNWWYNRDYKRSMEETW
ncbi:hypothetical protein SERLADRAFT_440116 [Serpula lacrymans var. lacrymans S7.9]|uniref:DUF6589 domain-containing protein n=1 Tax=Serpula lacrymans var. lacrymans (strain S7.9) TaxID=578457 RepID=F8P3J4_SERL9|nr:uncharacterized protein SERLADRAFT_440116 [Serpula lacrymans var. lacrymans S7.9]EGO22093.1 hypothetical protein SERLADRAFT_440116 [Serpula lacrymans var. lacrymans S7.9]